tara:strand:+ start:130 stop:597 length:468 start_codon:yes stop_codon:yes gene_type:complete
MSHQIAELHRGAASAKIDALSNKLSGLPQVECEVNHYFGPNIYIREIVMPKGVVVVGRSHKGEHMCSMVSGRVIVVDEDGVKTELVAPLVYKANPGRKTLYVMETTRFQNIFSTPETDLVKLEEMLVEKKLPRLPVVDIENKAEPCEVTSVENKD